MKKTMYVSSMCNENQESIKAELRASLEVDYQGEELEEAIENGMNSRLCDLEDTIDISKYL